MQAAHRHHKAIGAWGDGAELLTAAGITPEGRASWSPRPPAVPVPGWSRRSGTSTGPGSEPDCTRPGLWCSVPASARGQGKEGSRRLKKAAPSTKRLRSRRRRREAGDARWNRSSLGRPPADRQAVHAVRQDGRRNVRGPDRVGHLTAHDEAEHSALCRCSESCSAARLAIEKAAAAHSAVKKQIDRLKFLEGATLTGAVEGLRALVGTHVADEEKRLLPRLAKAATPQRSSNGSGRTSSRPKTGAWAEPPSAHPARTSTPVGRSSGPLTLSHHDRGAADRTDEFRQEPLRAPSTRSSRSESPMRSRARRTGADRLAIVSSQKSLWARGARRE